MNDNFMKTKDKIEFINNDVVAAYKSIYGNDLETIYLYGSYARNEEADDSDIDYIGLINRTQEKIKKSIYELWDCTGDIDLDHNVVVSAMAVESKDFKKNCRTYPYYINVLKDGIKIYDRSDIENMIVMKDNLKGGYNTAVLSAAFND